MSDLTSQQRDAFDQMKVAVHAEIDGMIEYWGILRQHSDFNAALMVLTQSLYDSNPTVDDLVRLVTLTVALLAEDLAAGMDIRMPLGGGES